MWTLHGHYMDRSDITETSHGQYEQYTEYVSVSVDTDIQVESHD